ncbi:SDR family oxidoreductase [Gracilibacillus kekensis]|uniref:NADP-dependent 3-hydroxy acid dehydrogenase YdfG n=1 Tax=Gracilibacillus kekensis TaxID=1027249 RepID=A0A1M7QTQ5_9BACI|nr:SDR family oxidoreductase [Gracilibacillus kekensis]SHN34851.1 NADP-dependent 3-hydroxy acid dehydrogenase YdfG [Gracilibacillus kekensis]
MGNTNEKVIIIVGATGGLGTALCELLAKEKVKLVLASSKEEPLMRLKQELEDRGSEVLVKATDVTSEREVESLMDLAASHFGKVDVLLNLAGLSIPSAIEEMDINDYKLTMDVNVLGTFLCSKHFLRKVNEQEGGLIINIGSMAAKRANPNAPLYCTAKAAVNMFSQGLALQVKEKNTRVTTINPGAIDTTFWEGRNVPREKFLQAEDVADVIHYVLNSNPKVVIHEISLDSLLFFK